MSYYDINTDPLAYELLPVEHRDKNTISIAVALLKACQWVQNIFFDQYRKGVTYPIYSPGTYNRHDLVVYGKKLYESLEGSNTSAPTDLTKWKDVLVNLQGMNERIQYNTSKLMLEYALNKTFETNFRQPPNVPDIYVDTNIVDPAPFIIGVSEEESSNVVYNELDADAYIMASYTISTQKMCTIWVPLTTYTALSTDAATREGIIRSFVDRIIEQGITYDINTY